jgi:hypothetical protein
VPKLLAGVVLIGLLVLGGGVAISRSVPDLTASGPTTVDGTDATSVFKVGDRVVRQVRYVDGGTLAYTFILTNPGPLPLDVQGLSDDQVPTRLFTLRGLTVAGERGPWHLGVGERLEVRLTMKMGGCESLSSRAGAFVSSVRVRTEQAGRFADDVEVALPEELHTGSPREAFCPNSTATSRPPG